MTLEFFLEYFHVCDFLQVCANQCSINSTGIRQVTVYRILP